jgi:S1-C subfamily serine protease
VLGGLVVAGGFVVLGLTGRSTTQTIFAEAPVAAETASRPGSGLTADAIYQRDAPGVVYVRATLVEPVRTPFDAFREPPTRTSTGSGFLVDRRGDILTAYHLVDGADEAGGVTIGFEGGVQRPATLVAAEPDEDIAVLRVEMSGVPSVRPLPLGDSTSVRVGDPTLAIGNPFGVDRTLTTGIVSALQHRIEAAGGFSVNNVIQTQQPLTPGNSGGPLLDADGRVIGIDSQVASDGGQPIAFATPIDTAQPVLHRVQVRLGSHP